MSRAKDYLQKVKADEDARAACEKQIAALESCAYRITPFYGVRTGSGGAVNSDDKIARLMDAKAECEANMENGLYTAHEVAVIIADLFGDDCACNFNDIDEWLPFKCELIESCPNTYGVACWEQYLKYRNCKDEMEAKDDEV